MNRLTTRFIWNHINGRFICVPYVTWQCKMCSSPYGNVVEFTMKLLLPIPHVVDWFFISCNLDYTFYKIWKKEMNCFYNAKVPGKIHLPLSESNSFDHSKSTFIERLRFNTVIKQSTFCSCTSILCIYVSKDIQGYSDVSLSLDCQILPQSVKKSM